jgi:hypothetical protein
MEGRLDRVKDAPNTLLFADCGSRPLDSFNALDRCDGLVYTTNYMSYNGGDPVKWGTLGGILETSWLRGRIPRAVTTPRLSPRLAHSPGRGGKDQHRVLRRAR